MATTGEISSQGIASAKEIIQALLRAKRSIRLYPSNNPMYVKIMEDTYDRFRDFFGYNDRLVLRFSRDKIFMGKEVVYRGTDKEENFAFFFFRDGLKSLVFEGGIEKEELQSFLHVISVDFENELVEDDLVTLLWETDFANISYTVDENVLAGEAGEEANYEERASEQAKDGALEEDNIKKAYEEAMGVEEMDTVPQMPITENDLKALSLEMEKNAGDKTVKLADILFNMLYLAESVEEFKEVARIVSHAVEYSVKQTNLMGAAVIVKRTKELIEMTTSHELKKALNLVLTNGGAPSLIRFIGEQIDIKGAIREEDFNEYVRHLEANAISPFVDMLGELKSMSARKYVINALAYLGGKDVSKLTRGLKDERWYVVRNIINALRRIGDRGAENHLLKIADHSDARVRKEVMRALGELGGQRSAAALQESLDDPDKSVRSSAIRALGSIGSDYARAVLLARLADKQILNAGFFEIREGFEVLARWKHDEVFGFLMGVIRQRPFFGRAKHDEYRACAVYALGLMNRKEAMGELEKLRRSRNKLLGEYAFNAIKRIEHGG